MKNNNSNNNNNSKYLFISSEKNLLGAGNVLLIGLGWLPCVFMVLPHPGQSQLDPDIV